MCVSIVYATPKGPADYEGWKKGHHLYLYSKNHLDWDNVEDWGPEWGKLSWKEDRYVFNGHRLLPDTEYALIRYLEEWPWCQILGFGVSGEGGSVHIEGNWEIWEGKFWLVRAEDVLGWANDNCEDELTAWAPEHWLFEYNILPSST